MRIVVDTNVLISGSGWKGKPAEVLDLIEEGQLKLCVSPDIIQEYWEVITRDFVPEGAKLLLTSLLNDEQIIMEILSNVVDGAHPSCHRIHSF